MLEVSHLLRSAEIDSENRFHRMDVVDFGNSPEIIAQLVRRSWGIPSGAINNLTETIEDAGGIIISFSFGTNKIDAMSQWAFDLPPIICINTDAPGDRLRFSLAHELGHIVMHQVPTIDLEKEADRFASEFLMPKTDVAPYLNRLSLAKLASLKPLWKVSMQALLERAYNLNKITSNQRQYLWRQISKSGYRTKEPVEILVEKPKTIYELIEFHQNDLGYSQAELSSLLRITTSEFQRKYFNKSTEKILRLI
jgi:Zn-dependent peptidase ImmA (M78 family)